MHKFFQKIPKTIALSLGVLCLSLVIGIIVFAWQEPTLAPPGGNVATPLNTSNVGQSKAGGLILNTGGAEKGLIIDKGKICLGSDCRGSWIEVAGSQITFKMTASSYVDAQGVYRSKTVSYTCPINASVGLINCKQIIDTSCPGYPLNYCKCDLNGSNVSVTQYVIKSWRDWYQSSCDTTSKQLDSSCTIGRFGGSDYSCFAPGSSCEILFQCGLVQDVTPQ